jgi:hypothetical protein
LRLRLHPCSFSRPAIDTSEKEPYPRGRKMRPSRTFNTSFSFTHIEI